MKKYVVLFGLTSPLFCGYARNCHKQAKEFAQLVCKKKDFDCLESAYGEHYERCEGYNKYSLKH